MEEFILGLPMYVNVLLLGVALYIVLRASHYLVEGSIQVASEFNINPHIIGATDVAMGTSSAELTVNLVVARGDGDTSTLVVNILGSDLVNLGIELGVSALIAVLLIIQYACAEEGKSLLLVETTTMVEISHRSAAELTRRKALTAMVGGLVVLVLGSRLLVLNTTAVAAALNVPEFIIGLVIIEPGTSLPEIAS